MKKLAVFLGIALFVMSGCSDDGEMIHDVLVHRMQYVAPGADEPFNGERTFYYDSGAIQSKAEYVNGYPEHIVNFYPTGEKRHVFIYKANELKSRTTWFKNGQKKFQSSGDTIREWYKNGQLKGEAHYGDDGGTLH
ncbi:MAG TPA: hypothetical protein VFG39_01610, partial [Balneolaceae bacterium]|nr:hypothetical protein [Balneolaceae bacterium]